MSALTKPKVQEEPFTYSWYLPVPGGKSSGALGGPAGPAGSEMELAPGAEEVEDTGPDRGQIVQQVEVPNAKSSALGILSNVSMSTLRLAGLAGWTAAAAAGMVAMMAFQAPLALSHVLALVGVWAAISAAVWILPTKLMK